MARSLSNSRLALVTGGSGAIGAALIARLQEGGWAVRCSVHDQAVHGTSDTIAWDLSRSEAPPNALSGVRAVFHLAARTHARRAADYEALNVTGSRRLVDAAKAEGVERFVHISTRAIDPSGGGYSWSKARAEELVRGSGLRFTIVRLPEVYGIDSGEGLGRMIDQARRGRPVLVVGDGSDEMGPIHVDDAIDAIVRSAEAPESLDRVYTLAGSPMSALEVAEACVAAFGSRSRIVRVPRPGVAALSVLSRFIPLPIYPDQLARLSAPKPQISPEAANHLGFAPRAIETGLGRLP